MNTAAPFLCSVSSMGVPNFITTCESSTYANITELSSGEISRIYWNLSALSVAYQYSIDGIGTYGASYVLDDSSAPITRMISPQIFRFETADYSNWMARGCFFDLGEIFANASLSTTYDLHLDIREGPYPYMEILLSTTPVNGYVVIDESTFSFMGRTIPVFLLSLPNFFTGNILAFSVTPSFWDY